MIDAALGMLFLHQKNPPIIHRDLKGPNLLVRALRLPVTGGLVLGTCGLRLSCSIIKLNHSCAHRASPGPAINGAVPTRALKICRLLAPQVDEYWRVKVGAEHAAATASSILMCGSRCGPMWPLADLGFGFHMRGHSNRRQRLASSAQVADFNLSRVALEEGGTAAATSSLAALNPRWLAPELISGGSPATCASDVYSYALVMYEALTWRLPWGDLQPLQVGGDWAKQMWEWELLQPTCL